MSTLADLIPNPVTKRHWEHVEDLKGSLDALKAQGLRELLIPAVGIAFGALVIRLSGSPILTDPLAALSAATPWVALVVAVAGGAYGQYLAKCRAKAQADYDQRVGAFARHISRTPFCQCGAACDHKEAFILRAEREAGVKLYLHW